MNIEATSNVSGTSKTNSTSQTKNNSSSSFSDELSTLASKKTEKEKEAKNDTSDKNENMDKVIDGLEGAVAEMNEKLNQSDEKDGSELKDGVNDADKNNNEDNALINNDMNIPDPADALTFQMGASMSFNSNGQQFSEFMNNQNGSKLSASSKDLAEERAVLSSMDENIAIANRNRVLAESPNKKQINTLNSLNSDGSIETIVTSDKIIMNENDVDFFAKLVENGQADSTHESFKVSKTLADLIAKSMKDNQPIRIDFDNNISVIIKIGKDGKISADFLPSSQIAEAYLKENLPLLKQKFQENNLDYNELNHRQHKQQNEKEDQKKGRKNE